MRKAHFVKRNLALDKSALMSYSSVCLLGHVVR
jgi:hypothetical protein